VWLDGKDVDAVYEEFKAAGAKIRPPPPHQLLVGSGDAGRGPGWQRLAHWSDPRPGEPYGDWLDMYGDRWGRTADGQPVRVEVK